LADAFVRHYENFADVHIILHGPEHESPVVVELAKSGRLKIHSKYDSEFSGAEKGARLSSAAQDFVGRWVLTVDSDELVEFPYATVYETIEALKAIGLSSLRAPMLQRLRHDGTIDSSEIIRDPFAEFPLCSENLYRAVGSSGALDK